MALAILAVAQAACQATLAAADDSQPVGTTVKAGQGVSLLKRWPNLAEAQRSDLTIELWIKPDAEAILRPRVLLLVLSNRGGSDVKSISLTFAQGVPVANVLGTRLTGNKPLIAGRWSHLALTIDTQTINKQAHLWIDGQPAGDDLVLEPWPGAFQVGNLLSDPWRQQRVFSGQLGDVRASGALRYREAFQPTPLLKPDTSTLLRLEGAKIPFD